MSLTKVTYAMIDGAFANILDYGADDTGVTDSTASIQAALNAVNALGGGTVVTPNGGKFLIDGNLTIPANVTLLGPMSLPGTPGDNTSAPYGDMPALILNSAATITLNSGAGINGTLIYRKGMTFPAANSSAYAGTAITAAGDDCFVRSTMILGFDKAYVSSGGASRPTLEDVKIDCQNGIDIQSCFDIARLVNIHCWPFATIAASGTLTRHHRTGNAFYLHDTVDGPMLTNCFSYGYLIGFYFKNVSTISATGCFADNTKLYSGSAGWRFDNFINGFQGVGNAAWSCDNGIFLNHAAQQYIRVSGFTLNGNNFASIIHFSGDVDLVGNYASSSQNFYSQASLNAAASIVQIDYNTVASMSIAFASGNYASSTLRVGDHNHIEGVVTGTLIGGTTPTSTTLASADPMQIWNIGSVFNITGTTNFGALGAGWAGRVVTLVFSNVLTVSSSATPGSGMRLNGSAAFVTAAGSTLTLAHDGVQWYEIGRSA